MLRQRHSESVRILQGYGASFRAGMAPQAAGRRRGPHAAQEKDVEICRATLDLFLSILGNEAGNLVLQVLATGGVYLGGGIPPRILNELKGEVFFDSFSRKGRFSSLLEQAPVDVIVNPMAALYGAANFGLLTSKG